MRRTFFIVSILLLMAFTPSDRRISPYIKVGDLTMNMTNAVGRVKQVLKAKSFRVLGTYHPGGKSNLAVVAFTRNDLKNTVIKVKDRGALAGVLKVGLVKKQGRIEISYLRPEYIFRAYLRDSYASHKGVLQQVNSDVDLALKNIGNEFQPFGGELPVDELKKYHYKIMMPYFTDPVELREFDSFDEGLRVISANLKAGKSHTKLVYTLSYIDKQVAVFGVGLMSKDKGEAHFLPKIGESHVAAMPYEIILQGNKATMLHGRYRLALHWPELSMGTFMTIVSTPGDIEDTLKSICYE